MEVCSQQEHMGTTIMKQDKEINEDKQIIENKESSGAGIK